MSSTPTTEYATARLPKAKPAESDSTSSFLASLGDSLRRPDFWAYSSWLDIVTKYRRTRLGLLWAIAPVAVFVGLIGGFYSEIIGRDPVYFMPYLGIGYTIWRFMVQCTADSASVLRSHKAFIMDGRTRLTDFVLRSLAKAFFYLACACLVVLAALIWSPITQWQGVLVALVTFPIVVLNMIWWSTCMALIGARHADAGEFIATTTRIGLLITPIIWVGDRFPPGTIGWWAVHVNPAYHLITIVRAPILGDPVSPISYIYIGCMTVLGWLLAMLLYRRYARFVPLWI